VDAVGRCCNKAAPSFLEARSSPIRRFSRCYFRNAIVNFVALCDEVLHRLAHTFYLAKCTLWTKAIPAQDSFDSREAFTHFEMLGETLKISYYQK
jgi:hypothetical protein